MRLAAASAVQFAIKQMILPLIDVPKAEVSGLIDILFSQVSESRLYRFAQVASDVPERSVQRVAAAATATGDSWSTEAA